MKPPSPRPVHFGSEASKTQRVIAVGAHGAVIPEPRPVGAAQQADMTFVTIETTGGGWGHGSLPLRLMQLK
jgi:hypothetical protein